MKFFYLLLYIVIMVTSCTRLPLMVSNLTPINTNLTPQKAEVNIAATLFSSGQLNPFKPSSQGGGQAVQFKAAPIKNLYFEGSVGNLQDAFTRELVNLRNSNVLIETRKTNYSAAELGIGAYKTFNKNLTVFLSIGKGSINYKSNYNNNSVATGYVNNINFKNNVVYFNTGIDFCYENLAYTITIKNSYTTFNNINTSDPVYYTNELQSINNLGTKRYTQFQQTLGLSKIPKLPWLGIKFFVVANFSANVIYLDYKKYAIGILATFKPSCLWGRNTK